MSLNQVLTNLIKLNGPISVSNFMNEALFNPKYGYYTTQNPIGKSADFITAPEISQVFGELIGAYLVNLWQNIYQNKPVTIVEMGAGKGTLMKDLLNFAAKIEGFNDKCQINIVEISPHLQKIQKKTLEKYKVNWHQNFSDFYDQNNKNPILYISNELFDCFAINQYQKLDNFWHERKIGLDSKENLSFILDKKDELLDKKIKILTNNKGNQGDIFEHSPASDEFMQNLSKAIHKTNGVALICDYGYQVNNFKDTFQALKDHKFSNPLEDIGYSDLTAHVNFIKLSEIATQEKLQSWVVTQKEFLETLGVKVREQSLMANKNPKQQSEIKSAINRLISEDEMGILFKFLICSKL